MLVGVTVDKSLAAKIRNLLNLATLKKRSESEVAVETDFSRTIEGEEFFPYGFVAKAKKGRTIVLTQGGDAGSYIILPISSIEGCPELDDGDAALWSEGGGFVISRADKKLELNGTDLGGLVKADELKTQLDKMTARIDGIINAITSAAVAAGDGGATFKANMALSLQALVNKEDFSNIKNSKVSHGEG